MSDDNERSVASTGSVAGEEADRNTPEPVRQRFAAAVNLWVATSHTLTDAEREAVERACRFIAPTMPYESQQGAEDYQTLRCLLARMEGGE